MKKNISRLLFGIYALGIIITNACSQNLHSSQGETEDYKVYSEILLSWSDGKGYEFIVNKLTNDKMIRQFNFKNPKEHLIDTISDRVIYNDDWKHFLDDVNPSQIRNHDLSNNFKGGSFRVHLSEKNKGNTFPSTVNYERYNGTIFFSPILFSEDHKKAICTIENYVSPENAGGTIVFLQKEGGKWVIVDHITLFIS